MKKSIKSTPSLTLVLLLLITGLAIFPVSLAQGVEEVFLFFPDVIHTNELQTALAFANQSGTRVAAQGAGETASLVLFFIDDTGTVVQGSDITNPAVIDVGLGEQIAQVLPDIFGIGIVGRSGFVVVESDVIAVVGFFLTFDPAIGMIDGADAIVAPVRREDNFFSFGRLFGSIIFQEVLVGPGATNKVYVLGLTGPNPANGRIHSSATDRSLRISRSISRARSFYFPALRERWTIFSTLHCRTLTSSGLEETE